MKRKITTVLLLALLLSMFAFSVQAEEGLNHVTDEAGILTDTQIAELESLCLSVSDEYAVGVYIVTLDDYTNYGNGSVYDVTYGIYHDYTMGRGTERNGIMLLLSMIERDFATFVYGDDAQYAFGDYALQQLESEFLPYFGNDDWYGGFRAYASACETYLGNAEAGEPLEEGKGGTYVMVFGVSFLIALIVVSILGAGMKNVSTGREAGIYVSRQLNLTRHYDRYTHTTRVQRKIESDSRSRSGGGGSGRSGKF